MDSDNSTPKKYKVTLKSGDWAVFSNDNNFDNYQARLVSGIYGIASPNGDNLKITPETVASIQEVDENNELSDSGSATSSNEHP